jgi:rare lipoprotein A (peptidoglycan hydrolase)
LDVGSPHPDHHSSRSLAALDRGGALRDVVQLVLSYAAFAVSRRSSVHCFGFAKRATVAKLHLIATALLQLLLSEPTHAADRGPDECGLASVYSSLSEETASGEDTSENNFTAAHRSLPFQTLVLVENKKNGCSVVVRITDRGPFVAGRIRDVSQAATHELLRKGQRKLLSEIRVLRLSKMRPPPEAASFYVAERRWTIRASRFWGRPLCESRGPQQNRQSIVPPGSWLGSSICLLDESGYH